MNYRRVVVSNVNGISTVVEDGQPTRLNLSQHTPGFASGFVWSTEPKPILSSSTTDPTLAKSSFLPAVGGTSLLLLTLPPDSVYADPSYDPVAAGAEAAESSPGLAELFERDNPGMHTTPTVDYDVVIEGEVWLELSEGEVHLTAGDVVVQHGTRHAWRNKGDKPATVLAVLIGAQDRAPAEDEDHRS
ncbi:cupin domain-containing protein [Rhodococcus wratislaviensis]|uniref:cupin domain-containing protein n=1 Tax=Rhodococcus wratislaviensis TaxID=44752 RepID=UPI0036670750